MAEADLKIWEVTQSELAQFFGVSQQTIRRWNLRILRRQGRFAVYDLREAVQAKYQAEQALDLNQERARLAKAQREKLDLELAARAGELLEAKLVVRAWESILVAFRSHVERAIAALETATGAGELEPGLGGRLSAGLRDSLAELAAFDVVAVMPGEGDPAGPINGHATATDVDRKLGRRKPRRKPRSKRARRKVAH